jgi:hypothetical protein
MEEETIRAKVIGGYSSYNPRSPYVMITEEPLTPQEMKYARVECDGWDYCPQTDEYNYFYISKYTKPKTAVDSDDEESSDEEK